MEEDSDDGGDFEMMRRKRWTGQGHHHDEYLPSYGHLGLSHRHIYINKLSVL